MSFYDDFTPFRFRDRTNNFVNDFRNEFENNRNNMWGDNFGTFFAPRHADLRSRMAQHRPEFFHAPKPPAAAPAGASAGPSEFTGERVIPIHICTEDEDGAKSSSTAAGSAGSSACNGEASGQKSAGATASSSNGPQSDSPKSYAPQRNNTAEIPRVKEISRNQRAQSAPPSGAGIHMAQCGGGQSKKATNNAGREIPIQIEIQNSSSAAPKGQHGPQKTAGAPHNNANKTAGPKGQPRPEQESKPTPPKKPLVLDPMEKIKSVADQVQELAQKVNAFTKESPEKDYLYLDEMLTRCLIQLDDVEVEGKDDLRQARREVIKSIQKCISDLEQRAGKQPVNSDVAEDSGQPMAEDTASAAGDAAAVNSSNPADSSEANLNATEAAPAADLPQNGQAEPMAVDQDQAVNSCGDHINANQENNVAPANATNEAPTPGEKLPQEAKQETPTAPTPQETEKMET